MNRSGKDLAQLNKLEFYMKDLQLLDSRNSYPDSGFSIAAVRGLKYVDVWRTHIKRQWYDIRLDDNSLFYFYKEGSEVSFSFLGCPYICAPYSVYKAKAEFEDMEESFIQECYEDELSTSEIKSNPYYFRYDYEDGSYRQGEHPVAHLHCGLMENVRIGSKKELDIMSFAAFVLRQVYIQQWDVVLNDEKKYHELHVSKVNLSDIKAEYYQSKDKDQDFYLI